MGMLLSLMLKKDKSDRPEELANLEEVHVISYGAPKILAKSAYDEFNKQILSKDVTITRIESVGRIVGDAVTGLPLGNIHPGATDTKNTIDVIRSNRYGVTVDGNYRRNEQSWPFSAPYNLWDPSNAQQLKERVMAITNEPPPTPEQEKSLTKEDPQNGGYYVKVKGARDTANPHVEQLGMYFMGSQRLPLMVNPANTRDRRIFTSNIWKDCSTYEYLNGWIPFGGGKRKTYRKKSKNIRKTMKQ
jgi:hypothetical protein